MESGRLLHKINRIGFTDIHVFGRDFQSNGAVADQGSQNGCTGFVGVKHIGLEALTHLAAEIIQILALGVIKIHQRDGSVAYGCQIIFRIGHAVIAVNTGDHKRRNNENHGDKHHPALMRAKSLKHYFYP